MALCFQAFLFLIDLRHPNGFVSDCFQDDLGEGSGASPIPFLKGTGRQFHLAVVSQDLTRGYRQHNQGFAFLRFKGHQAVVFLRQYAFFYLSFNFWQNGRKMTAWRAHEQYVHESHPCIIKFQNMPWSKSTTMRTNRPFVYYLLRLMMGAHAYHR